MLTETPDALVIGLGAMGSAIAYQLAKRGVNVIGIDQFAPPHSHGSTHGETRITRQAIGEGAEFVPLVLRSHMLWREIEVESSEALLTTCGGLILARDDNASYVHGQADFLANTFHNAEKFNIPHEKLDAREIAKRYPQFMLQGDEIGYFEPGAGYLNPEACIRAQLQSAQQRGAILHQNEKVVSINTANGKTIVETNHRRFAAGVTIVAAGAWASQLLPALSPSLTVRRQVLYWFALDGDTSYAPANMPIFIWAWGTTAADTFYGFPQIGNERVIKVATAQLLTTTDPNMVNRIVHDDEVREMFQRHLDGRLHDVSARCIKSATCLYTSTADGNFIIDRLPNSDDMIVVSACSGHGFKHSAAIGEAVAAMAISGNTPDVLRPFAWTK
jgi:sarcosine oxidase